MAQKARRDRRPPSRNAAADAGPVAGLESFGSDLQIGPGMETAAIGDVTPAMMDEAAYRAAVAVEAAVDPSVIEAGRVDEEHSDDAALPPTMDPVVLATTENQTDIEDAPVSSEEDSVEAMPVLTVSAVEANAASALVQETAASMDKEIAALGEVSASLVEDMPPVDVSTPKAAAAGRTDETLRWDLSSPGEAIGAYGAQVVEMLAANIAASGHFLTALMSATSVTDVLAVNTSHLRRQMELLTTQRRQLTRLARTITFDAMKPFGALPTDHGRDR